MKITRRYQHSGITVLSLGRIRDYLNQHNSRSLGERWGHKIYKYQLYFGPDQNQEVQCVGFGELEAAVEKYGETRKFHVHFESRTGRLLKIDATVPHRITVEADNKGGKTIPFLERVEEILRLQALPRRVFVTHGHSTLWLQIARFIEKDLGLYLDVVELAEEPNKGRTISEKLVQEGDQCSYAVIVMTGDDFAGEDEIRARENVIHEVGYFQGRYGNDRICLLHEEGVNIPSNLGGVAYYEFPKGDVRSILSSLQKELRAAFEESND